MDDLGELKRRFDRRDVSDNNRDIIDEGDANDQVNGQAGVGHMAGLARDQEASTDGTEVYLASEVELTSPSTLSSKGKYIGVAMGSHEVAEVGFVTLDGYHAGAQYFATACDLGPFLVQHGGGDEGQLLDNDDVDQALKFESLHEVITSTGFYLE